MKFKIILSILILINFSCKQEKQIDYTFLNGHWVIDSIYVAEKDTLLKDPYSDSFLDTKEYYSFSEDMFFVKRVDSFIRKDAYFVNKPNREYLNASYFYSLENDSIKTFSLNYKKYNQREFVLKRSLFDLKCESLTEDLLVLAYRHSVYYLSKTNNKETIKSKKDMLYYMNLSDEERTD